MIPWNTIKIVFPILRSERSSLLTAKSTKITAMRSQIIAKRDEHWRTAATKNEWVIFNLSSIYVFPGHNVVDSCGKVNRTKLVNIDVVSCRDYTST